MAERILFFDDEPGMGERFKSLLQERGYVISSPRTLEEVLFEIRYEGADLLIHFANKTKTHWSLCDALFEQFPEFPSLHVSMHSLSEMYQTKLIGPFHERLKYLSSEKDFLSAVKKTITLGKLHQENKELKNSLLTQEKLQKIFGTLDSGELQRRVVDFFCKDFKAENAYFLLAGGFHFYKEELWKIIDLHGAPNGLDEADVHHLVAAKETTRDELASLLNKIANYLPADWHEKSSPTVVNHPKSKSLYVFVPLVAAQMSKILGHVLLVKPQHNGDQNSHNHFAYLGKTIGRHFEHVSRYTNAKSLNYIDDLTELYNQRYLKLVLDKEISRCQRMNQPFSVLFMDIDHFKKVNDSRGHLIGSKVLVELSKILHGNIRTMDYGFRYGGDEFLLILVNTTSEGARVVAERIRRQVEASTFNVDGSEIQVTLSIGVASFPEHALTKEQIIELADKAMYCGKNKSRNVVYVAS